MKHNNRQKSRKELYNDLVQTLTLLVYQGAALDDIFDMLGSDDYINFLYIAEDLISMLYSDGFKPGDDIPMEKIEDCVEDLGLGSDYAEDDPEGYAEFIENTCDFLKNTWGSKVV